MSPNAFARQLALLAALILSACARPAAGPEVPPPTASIAAPVAGDTSTIIAEPATATGHGWADSESPVPVSSNDPHWGNRDAPVTLVVFGDYECPFTARLQPVLEELRGHNGPSQVRIVWKHNPLPFHKNALRAAIAAETVRAIAGNEAFWAFHDRVFRDQKHLSREDLVRSAVATGLDRASFSGALDDGAYAAKVDEDIALAKKLGARGTPRTIVNGINLTGAQPRAKFDEMIRSQLKAASRELERGTQPDQVYVKLSSVNWEQPEPTRPTTAKTTDSTVWKVPIGRSPVLGPATAPVTIVIFAGFECPFSKRVQSTLEQVRTQYGNKVRFVWKDKPLAFHKRAHAAATFAREARRQKRNKGFWAAHDKLFKNQRALTDADLETYAKELGLNLWAVRNALKRDSHKRAIAADVELAEKLKASGTPHFFINGERLVGARPFESFKAVIDRKLLAAKVLTAAGTPPARVYAKIQKTAQAPSPPPPPPRKTVPPPTKATPWTGNQLAKVVVQAFGDYQCPYTARSQDTLKVLLVRYPGRLKLVWRHNPLPFHKDAQLASEAAVEAFVQKGNRGFWAYHDKLFRHQRDPHGLERAALDTYAGEVGLDMVRFGIALDQRTHRAAVQADANIARTATIRGTPAFVINGYHINGAQPLSKFVNVVDRALQDIRSGRKP